MKIGFIGCGNMASAIICGALKSKKFQAEQIGIFDLDTEKSQHFAQENSVTLYGTTEDLIKNSSVLVLAVKPQVLPSVLSQHKGCIKEKSPLIISIAAGKQIKSISEALGYDARIIRVMPNINAKVLQAMSAYCPNEFVSEQEEQFVESLMTSCGKVLKLSEDLFPLFGVLAGCAPAYSYMFTDALAKAASCYGIDYRTALDIASQTVLGSAQAMLCRDTTPEKMIDNVCSPGGTTIEGVNSLNSDCFYDLIAKAFKASLDKDEKLR